MQIKLMNRAAQSLPQTYYEYPLSISTLIKKLHCSLIHQRISSKTVTPAPRRTGSAGLWNIRAKSDVIVCISVNFMSGSNYVADVLCDVTFHS